MANQSQTINSMSTKRANHAGVALDSKRYVVIGGYNYENYNNGLKTLEMFDHQTKQWIDIPLKCHILVMVARHVS